MRLSVVSPIALTTTTTWLPRCFAATALQAALWIRSASATLVPPNFWTIKPMKLPQTPLGEEEGGLYERAGKTQRCGAYQDSLKGGITTGNPTTCLSSMKPLPTQLVHNPRKDIVSSTIP